MAPACSCHSSGSAASSRGRAIGPSHRPADPCPSLRACPGSRYTRAAMTHVFVAPHPDDVALSCGGLIASLRELGQTVTILTVFSGTGATGGGDGDADGGLTTYQREALGFGSKTMWPVTEAFNRSHISADYQVYGDPD